VLLRRGVVEERYEGVGLRGVVEECCGEEV
jgi:hypothetical protein